MSEESNAVDVNENGFGRIEVVPEILISIAQRSALRTTGVAQLAEAPNNVARRHARSMKKDGVLLELEDGRATFDLYVIMDANRNIMETARMMQTAIVEGIDTMIGIPVTAVNIHVEDVIFADAT